jgi:glycosyltransferase involved in cell wall biosynthesis
VVRTLSDNGVVAAARAPEVVWVFRRSRRQWLEEWQRGERSREFFYGLLTLQDSYHVGFVEDESVGRLRRPWYPVERIIAGRVGIGFALDLALRNLRALNLARVVISTVDTCGLALAFLKRAGLFRSRLIYISQGLSDRITAYGPGKWLPRRYRELLLGVEELVTLSAGAAAGLAAWLAVPVERIRVLPFGTDCEFWRDTAPPGTVRTHIVSVGSDAGRDYPTLLAAIDGLPLHIISAQRLPLGAHPTVVHSTAHSPGELRDIYSRARFVVIPLHDRSQPSGQSATLQAMACGATVVLTKTRGWWGESHLRDWENCVLVPPGDAGAVGQVLRRLWADPDACRRMGARARETVSAHFTEERMATALADMIAAHV